MESDLSPGRIDIRIELNYKNTQLMSRELLALQKNLLYTLELGSGTQNKDFNFLKAVKPQG